jgi:surface polysaccharide O-acyltransferase-like enzyme
MGFMYMKRKTGLDLVRTIAIFSVVGVHFFYHTNFYKVPVAGKSMMVQVALRWLFTMCVPLFIMLTGYLQTEKTPEKRYFKKLIPILGVYLFYSVLSIIMRIVYLKEDKSIIMWIISILTFDADKYSWYINMFIGLFL